MALSFGYTAYAYNISKQVSQGYSAGHGLSLTAMCDCRLSHPTDQAEDYMVPGRPPLRRFYYKVERKKGGKVAKVATARKLLEWMYHMMRDSKTFTEVEKFAGSLGAGEPAKKLGLIL